MRRLAILLAGAALAGAAQAEETPVDPEVARLEKETANLNAQAARDNAAAAVTNAKAARLQAQIDALGLPSPEGKTTLSTNAGVIETWMLSASAADAAARAIVGALPVAASAPARTGRPSLEEAAAEAEGTTAGQPTYLLLEDAEELNLDATGNLMFETETLRSRLAEAIPQQCKSVPVKAGGTEGGAFPVAAIGALVGLLKSDTDISGIDVTMADRMLVAAVGRRLTGRGTVILPSAAVAAPLEGKLLTVWTGLYREHADAKTCRERFAKNKQTPWVKKKLATLDAAIAAVTALDARVTKPDEKGRIPLAQAIRYDALLLRNPHVLRVHVEKAGGTVLKRSNLFTALGAPAVDLSGGLIVTHRLTEPRTGKLLSSGIHVCRTAVTNMSDVQTGRVRRKVRDGSNCDPLFPAG